jgi:hypothetical protein
MNALRSPEEVEWSTALDEYESMLQFHLLRLEASETGDLGDLGQRPQMPTPGVPMPSSLVPRALELLDRTCELEATANALQLQLQLELMPRRAPAVNPTLPTLLDRRL